MPGLDLGAGLSGVNYSISVCGGNLLWCACGSGLELMVRWSMLQVVLKQLKEAVGKAEVDQTTLTYVAALACPLIDRKIFDKGDWVEVRPWPAPCRSPGAALVWARFSYWGRPQQGLVGAHVPGLTNVRWAVCLQAHARLHARVQRHFWALCKNKANKCLLLRQLLQSKATTCLLLRWCC